MSESAESEAPSTSFLRAPERVSDLAWHRLYLEFVKSIPSADAMVRDTVSSLAVRQYESNRRGVEAAADAFSEFTQAGARQSDLSKLVTAVSGKSPGRGRKRVVPADVVKTIVRQARPWLKALHEHKRRESNQRQPTAEALHIALPFLDSKELRFANDSAAQHPFSWRRVAVYLWRYRAGNVKAAWVFEQAFGPSEAARFRSQEDRLSVSKKDLPHLG